MLQASLSRATTLIQVPRSSLACQASSLCWPTACHLPGITAVLWLACLQPGRSASAPARREVYLARCARQHPGYNSSAAMADNLKCCLRSSSYLNVFEPGVLAGIGCMSVTARLADDMYVRCCIFKGLPSSGSAALTGLQHQAAAWHMACHACKRQHGCLSTSKALPQGRACRQTL